MSNFAPVQLSYKVKLTNVSTKAGTYEVPTNEYARLTPKNSAGVVGQTVEFDIPTVTYTVSEYSLSYDANGGMGTMGFGLPAAIGATFGAPDRTVCLFIGDGGLQMTIEEFGTIMEQHAPVKIILLNNNFLGNVRQWQQLFFRHRYSFTPMMNPDYEKIAEAYNIPALTVTDRSKLDEAISQMLATPGPFLLQAAVLEEDNVLPMCCPGHDVDDMMLEA